MEFYLKKDAKGKNTCLSCKFYGSNDVSCKVARDVMGRVDGDIVACCDLYEKKEEDK